MFSGISDLLGASDHPPCDPGWGVVTDDSGQQTCVQPGGKAGVCDAGQSPYLDTQGDTVCYAPGLSLTPAPTKPASTNPLAALGISSTALVVLLVAFLAMRR